jgi:hypothetical protein
MYGSDPFSLDFVIDAVAVVEQSYGSRIMTMPIQLERIRGEMCDVVFFSGFNVKQSCRDKISMPTNYWKKDTERLNEAFV